MKKILALSLVVMALSFTGFAQSDAWVTYKSNPGHFSLSFPVMPQESVEYDSSSAYTFKINLVTYEIDANSVLMASWTDMSGTGATTKTIKQLLEDSRDGTTGAIKATKVTTTATNLTGDPYIEFTFSGPDFVGKDHIYYINQVQYSLITIFSPLKGIPADADKFIGSFKYLR